MKIPKLKRFDVVWIQWEDSMAQSGWMGIDETDIDKVSMICYSCGFFIQENKDSIVFSGSITPRDCGDHSIDGWMKIPKIAIQKITKVKL